MSKRNRNHAGKRAHEAHTVLVTPPKPVITTPREQLRTALGELRTSTTLLLETALSEVQHSAAAIVHELTSRAKTLLSSLTPHPRSVRSGAMHAEPSHNALS